MTYASANIEFDAMDHDHKVSVMRLFETLCTENILNVRDAFVAAVEDECKAIEAEMLLLGQTEGVRQ